MPIGPLEIHSDAAEIFLPIMNYNSLNVIKLHVNFSITRVNFDASTRNIALGSFSWQ